MPIAPYDRAFVDYYPNNGIVSIGTRDITIRDVRYENICQLRCADQRRAELPSTAAQISDSGSLNEQGRE